MKKLSNLMLLCVVCCGVLRAQRTNVSIRILDHTTKAPLLGATVHIKAIGTGGTTDYKGFLTLKNVPFGDHAITVSYVGYKTIDETLMVQNDMGLKVYEMNRDDTELESVVVGVTRSNRHIKDIPTRLEFIDAEELDEKTMMNAANISIVLRESTGIQMQQTSLSSFNSTIRIQGLDGRYTQLLKDGFPLYNGFSGGLSIMQIPPLDLNQFEIVKGSASTLYGGGAIAGLVNMVSKRPNETPGLEIMLSQTQAAGSTANIFHSRKKDKWGYTLYGSGNYQMAYDPDDDHFSNLPDTKTISFNPKIFYYPSDKKMLWLGVNATYDIRNGGDMTAIKTGKEGIHQYHEHNKSKRISTQLVYENNIDDDRTLKVKGSVSYFHRSLDTPSVVFSGTQRDIFSEIDYTINKGKFNWILGGNFYDNSFIEQGNTTHRNQHNTTFGCFANNTIDLSKKWILETGFRIDYSARWGIFPMPRLSLLWKPNDKFSSRLGGGSGYKIPTMFTEQAETVNYKNILALDEDTVKAENSYGINIDFNYRTPLFGNVILSANQLFYVTCISNPLLLQSQSSGRFLKFKNAMDAVLSRGAETNIKLSYNDFKWYLNYSFIDVTLNYLPGNPQKPLTPKHMAGNVLMYENEDWRIGYEVYYKGSQLLSSGVKTRDFFTMGLLLQRQLEWGSLYANFENFTDRRQSKFSPEVHPPHRDPNFAQIYAPTDGFIMTVGIIIKT